MDNIRKELIGRKLNIESISSKIAKYQQNWGITSREWLTRNNQRQY